MKIRIDKRDSDIRTDIKGARHPFYSNLIKSNKPEYNNNNITSERKTEIIDNIKKICEENNHRFIYEDGNYYKQERMKIRSKIKKALWSNNSGLAAKQIDKTKMAASALCSLSKGGTGDNCEEIREEGDEEESKEENETPLKLKQKKA